MGVTVKWVVQGVRMRVFCVCEVAPHCSAAHRPATLGVGAGASCAGKGTRQNARRNE